MAIAPRSPARLKTIYLIRHAQAEHNVRSEFHIPDAPLTALGKKQATELIERYPFLGKGSQICPQIIVTSPLTRTIETALLAFKPQHPQSEVMTMAELQENSSQACDTGSDVGIMRKRFPMLDFDHITEDWNSKTGKWSADEESLHVRAQDALARLSQRPEERIAVVTHGGFCSKLTQRWVRFENTECRVYKLVAGRRQYELQAVTSSDTEASRPLTTDIDATGAVPAEDTCP